MVLLFSPTNFLEILAFLLALAGFVLALRFFVDSRRRIEALFPGLLGSRKVLPFDIDRNGFVIPRAINRPFGSNKPLHQPAASSSSDNTKEEIKALRQQLQQQQQELAKALQKISLVNPQSRAAEEMSSSVLHEQKQLEQWRVQLENKEAEIQRLRQQELLSQKLQQRVEEVQAECERLQEKMLKTEKQAWRAAELSIQLEHAEQAQLQVEKNLAKKEERLRELTAENQQLQEAFNELEEKLAQANLQRQQLFKRIQFLEEVNADLQQEAEVNRKLKAEMSRVAELESMLEIMSRK
jgi:chromosome segregation ATPase